MRSRGGVRRVSRPDARAAGGRALPAEPGVFHRRDGPGLERFPRAPQREPGAVLCGRLASERHQLLDEAQGCGAAQVAASEPAHQRQDIRTLREQVADEAGVPLPRHSIRRAGLLRPRPAGRAGGARGGASGLDHCRRGGTRGGGGRDVARAQRDARSRRRALSRAVPQLQVGGGSLPGVPPASTRSSRAEHRWPVESLLEWAPRTARPVRTVLSLRHAARDQPSPPQRPGGRGGAQARLKHDVHGGEAQRPSASAVTECRD